jgi:hypothetical protein
MPRRGDAPEAENTQSAARPELISVCSNAHASAGVTSERARVRQRRVRGYFGRRMLRVRAGEASTAWSGLSLLDARRLVCTGKVGRHSRSPPDYVLCPTLKFAAAPGERPLVRANRGVAAGMTVAPAPGDNAKTSLQG